MTAQGNIAAPRTEGADETRTNVHRLTSRELLGGTTKLVIDHEGTQYTLRLTRQNKLLLTK